MRTVRVKQYLPWAAAFLLISLAFTGQTDQWQFIAGAGFSLVGFTVILLLTHRRYVTDIRKTSRKAESLERGRAEQAERHLQELKHYVDQLERSGKDAEENRDRLRHVAYHDALTGLPNRNFFTDRIEELIAQRDRRRPNRFAVLFLDLNRFKTINDSLGHTIGDKLIQSVGMRLSALLRTGDLVARFGGDEFAVLLEQVGEADRAVVVAEQIAAKIAEPMHLEGKEVFTSVSIGIAISSDAYAKAQELLRDADIAMYNAKAGQKGYEIFDTAMRERAVAIQQVETDLRVAIDGEDELELYYQPIVRLSDMELYGFEALVRWNHPTKGLVQPGDFIGISEATGLVIPMTLKLLENACRQMHEWEKNTARGHLSVSVNLSGRHFLEPDLGRQIADVLKSTDVDPSRLTLELTESAAMEDAENVIATLRTIKESGVRISIDDFGTGYSSLSYLHGFPVDALKIDRSFVQRMEDGSEKGEIVRTIIALAKALRLTVVAEGIENIHQLHQLRILGCELGQGYLFARPLPVREVEKILSSPASWETTFAPPPDIQLVEPIPQLEFTN
jgi:diguanylate cyclase (GGDEF)-like protein